MAVTLAPDPKSPSVRAPRPGPTSIMCSPSHVFPFPYMRNGKNLSDYIFVNEEVLAEPFSGVKSVIFISTRFHNHFKMEPGSMELAFIKSHY
jgi:hypothetical protein